MLMFRQPQIVNRIIGSGTALLVERPTEKPGAILTRVRVPGAARDFPPRVLQSPYSPRVQSHTSTSVRTLKIPNTGSHAIVGTLGNITHTDRKWVTQLCKHYDNR